ncbi:glycosyltransferase family 4 protein [Chloroflexota bacterium]
MTKPGRLCIVPQVSGIGGMVSFRYKLIAGLEQRGIQVSHDLADGPYQAVLVIGGTRQLAALWRVRRQGIPLVQRLDGMNWLHRMPAPAGEGRLLARRTGWRHFLRAEYGNRVLSLIRSRLASRVVYQSHFVQSWWQRVHGDTPVPSTVIYNGVNLQTYNPEGPGKPPPDRYRLLMVEGSLMGGYEGGLATGVALAQRLGERLERPVELMVVGRVAPQVQQAWQKRLAGAQRWVSLVWAGQVDPSNIPQIDRSAHLLFSADINAACPNAVIEALACGLPVVSFDTGAIPELVTGDAGRVAPYGGDPWQLDPPDIDALAESAIKILENPTHFRQEARRHAETAFGLDTMVQAYLDILAL